MPKRKHTKPTTSKRKKNKRLSLEEKEAISKLLDEGVSQAKIAASIGCSRTSIRYLARKLNKLQEEPNPRLRCDIHGSFYRKLQGCYLCNLHKARHARSQNSRDWVDGLIGGSNAS